MFLVSINYHFFNFSFYLIFCLTLVHGLFHICTIGLSPISLVSLSDDVKDRIPPQHMSRGKSLMIWHPHDRYSFLSTNMTKVQICAFHVLEIKLWYVQYFFSPMYSPVALKDVLKLKIYNNDNNMCNLLLEHNNWTWWFFLT